MTRPEKVREAQRLRAQGLKLREIAEQMGSTLKTVHTWLADPDLAKQRARRARYSRPCVDCGEATDGSGGYADPRVRCSACALAHQHEVRRWTPEAIVAAIQAFARDHQRVPNSGEWMAPARGSDFPSTNTVLREFGRWSSAIRAAGFETYKPRMPDREESAARRDQIVALYEQGSQPSDIARALGFDRSTICWHLDRAGIDRRVAA